MFMFTAKLNKGKAIVIVLLLAVMIAAIILLAHRPGGDVGAAGAASSGKVKTNADRIAYISSYGWEVSDRAIEEQSIVIPREFGDVYAEYNELQLEQGFDLSRYSGCEAVRYTYEVTNYPGDAENVVADIIVCRGEVIAGDIQDTSLDGFMQGLEFPK